MTKKLTNKEITQHLQQLHTICNQIGAVLQRYIEFKDDDANFRKHLIDLDEEYKKKQQMKENSDDPKDAN